MQEIEQAMNRLGRVRRQIQEVHNDFLVQRAGEPALPQEVTQLHLRREMVFLERQIREALVSSFGKDASEFRDQQHFHFSTASGESLREGLTMLDGILFQLEQARLHRLEEQGGPVLPGIDTMTQFYTEPLFLRYWEHEVSWCHRYGDPFSVLLFRVSNWIDVKERHGTLIGNEVLIGIVSACKTTVRGYDYHGRFGEAEFAIALRHANALGVASVAQRLLRHLAMAVNRIVPQGSLVLEFSTATYPFDAETIPDLLSTARCHWTVFSEQAHSDAVDEYRDIY
jgi:diguanylate cyclase (GGDEF)-like protein